MKKYLAPLLMTVAWGCSSDSSPGTTASPEPSASPSTSVTTDHPAPAPDVSQADADRALAIADEYKGYGRVDDEMRWAPFLCRLPMPGVAQMSNSGDQKTHGQKLYSVFVKDHMAYPDRSTVGQVVVKESFKAELVTDPAVMYDPESLARGESMPGSDHFYPYAQKDGKLYRATDAMGLYIMYRVAKDAPGSDDGWVYATITPDRKVTASGRIASCMGCHEEAPHDRLFGVAKSIESN